MLSNMTSGENSDLTKLVNVGDSQAALRMAGAVNSLLNSQSSKTPTNDTEGEDARKEKRKAVNMSFPLRQIYKLCLFARSNKWVNLQLSDVFYCSF